jgi:glycosyltransferase involved in cell wall biosynthesis
MPEMGVNDSAGDLEVSIVMPCLNEAETVASCILKARKAIAAGGLRAEIIVADNGSTDGSREIAERHGARVVPVPVKGYGAALREGILAASGRYIIMGDSDDSYDFTEILPFIERLRQGYDLVMGCRLPSGGGRIMPDAMPWKNRWIGNPVLSKIGRLFFRIPVTDFHCGLRGFSRDAFLRLNMHTTGMEFASEMIIKAGLLNMKISELPITLHKDGRYRPPHLRPWRDGWRHLRFMLMYSPRWLFLLPGIALMSVGAIFFGALLSGPLTVGTVHFDTNTLIVSAMAVLLGFQLCSFYLFTRRFALSEGLLPSGSWMDKLSSVITLEGGILIGVAMALGGGAILASAVIGWARKDFGPLSYPESLRRVIPGVTMIILGVQMFFSSFFIGILGLPRK